MVIVFFPKERGTYPEGEEGSPVTCPASGLHPPEGCESGHQGGVRFRWEGGEHMKSASCTCCLRIRVTYFKGMLHAWPAGEGATAQKGHKTKAEVFQSF